MQNAKILLFLLLGLTFQFCSSNDGDNFTLAEKGLEKYLHVPSPNWEDQIFYFIVTDRFMDGDTTNNDQGAGEYKKGDNNFWNGGDFQGIIQKMDYIKTLGATGIWITPPVANQWRNPQKSGTGNHGYWANDFMKVDKHLGSLEDYKQLSAALHKNDMYLIQDVVCNHLGDFYTYTGPYNPDDVSQNFKVYDIAQPTQYPFNHNDARNPKDREMAIYHFAPNFYDHSDTIKKRSYQFADLDDLNTSNQIVRKVLRESNNYWIKEVGVDGFRFDTPHMVEHDFWHDFIHSKDPTAPGVENFARSLGKKQFLTFGETAVLTLPFDDAGSYEAASYLGTAAKPEMTSILNFPLFSTLNNVFLEEKPTNQMTYHLEQTEKLFDHPEWLLNFIDNHDGARFLSQADRSSFQQALLFIMTIPGIPIIYYGTEQALLMTRQTMFKGGAGSPDQDHFNTENASFRFVQNLIKLRKENAIFRKGKLSVLRDASDGPGVFAYQLSDEKEYALVLLNTSDTHKLLDELPTEFSPRTRLTSFYNNSDAKMDFVVDQKGKVSCLLPPKAGIVLSSSMASEENLVETSSTKIKINPLDSPTISQNKIKVSGASKGISNMSLTINGNYEKAIIPELNEDGTWTAELRLDDLLNGKHRITAFSFPKDSLSPILTDHLVFKLESPLVFCGEYNDKIGDDRGPAGTYNYPSHISFSRQMDIEAIKVYKMGSNLKVDITMAELTQMWLPPNGFDHVLLQIYIDLPERKGAKILPQQNAFMPDDGDWDYLVSTAGFMNAIYSSEGATKTNPGKSIGPTSFVSADRDNRTISFLIPSTSMDSFSDLSGTKLYINTWDGGPGSLKEIESSPGPWSMSGGKKEDPKIMDDSKIIILE